MRSSLRPFVSVVFGALGLSCNSTETGNPYTPVLRSVPLQLAIYVEEPMGAGGMSGEQPSARPKLTELTLELAEIEALDCDDASTVTPFEQAAQWGSGTEEQARLPEGTLCRLIVRGAALDQGTSPETTPGAFIEGVSAQGPFRLMAPAPVGSFLRLDDELDLTTIEGLRLEVAAQPLLEEIEQLLSLPGNGLLEPGSPETRRLGEALGESLVLVQGVDSEREVLASSAAPTPDTQCADYCRAVDRAFCEKDCDANSCIDTLAEDECGTAFQQWVSCITRIPSQQLTCETGQLSDVDSSCAASLSNLNECRGGGAQR